MRFEELSEDAQRIAILQDSDTDNYIYNEDGTILFKDMLMLNDSVFKLSQAMKSISAIVQLEKTLSGACNRLEKLIPTETINTKQERTWSSKNRMKYRKEKRNK